MGEPTSDESEEVFDIRDQDEYDARFAHLAHLSRDSVLSHGNKSSGGSRSSPGDAKVVRAASAATMAVKLLRFRTMRFLVAHAAKVGRLRAGRAMRSWQLRVGDANARERIAEAVASTKAQAEAESTAKVEAAAAAAREEAPRKRRRTDH